MWSILEKANTIIQTLYIFYELYQFGKNCYKKISRTVPQTLRKGAVQQQRTA